MREHIISRLKIPAPPVPIQGAERGDHDLSPDLARERQPVPAAVLIPLVEHGDGLTVLFTQRTDHLADHAGQVAFPGGRTEADDADATATALRETHEEIGLPPERIEPVGQLETYLTGSGFRITPVVGFVAPPVPLKPDPFEVAEVFEVPLAFLLDPANRTIESAVWKGKHRDYYAYSYDRHYIWGVTAGIVVGFCDRLGEA